MARSLAVARRAFVVTLACLAFSAAAPSGQSAAVTPPDTVTFRSGVQYVEVDATVIDQDGKPVRDLKRDDFELREDGVAQSVDSFRLVDIPLPTVVPASEVEATAARDVMTNQGSGRVYVLLLDGSADAPFLKTRMVARRFVDEALGPDDLAAIMVANGTSDSIVAFTTDKAQLRRAIDGFVSGAWGNVGDLGNFGDRVSNVSARSRAAYQAYDLIRVVAERLGAVGDRRKSIVWFGGTPSFQQLNIRQTSEGFAQRDAIRTARANNIAIYPVDPYGLTVAMGRTELERLGALRGVAEDTGGEAVVNTNNFSSNYRRIVEQNSTYYVLGYTPLKPTSDGSYHRIAIRMKQPHLRVRAKSGYVSPDTSASLPLTPDSTRISLETQEALKSVLPLSGLSLDLTLSPFRGARGDASVLLDAQLRGQDLRLNADERIEVAELVIDPAGHPTGGRATSFTLNPREPQSAELLRYADRLDLPPGRSEVRLVVHQPNGATGSVIGQVDVPDFRKKALTMSGLLLAASNAPAHRSLSIDQPSVAALTSEPTLNRQFKAADTLSVWAQFYDTRTVPVDSLSVTGEIVSDTGRVMTTRTQTLTPAPGTCEGCFDYRDHVALSSLPAGDYVLRVVTPPAGQKQRVSREVPFTVRH